MVSGLKRKKEFFQASAILNPKNLERSWLDECEKESEHRQKEVCRALAQAKRLDTAEIRKDGKKSLSTRNIGAAPQSELYEKAYPVV